MKNKHTLSSEVVLSIQRFSGLKFSNITIEKEALNPKLPAFYNSLQPLYFEWLNYVRKNEKELWLQIRNSRNNFRFMLSTLEEFKKEVLQKKHTSRKHHLEKGNYYQQRQKEHLQYANDLYIEAYGVPLDNKSYSKTELAAIIKTCELDIFLNKTKQRKLKVVPLFS